MPPDLRTIYRSPEAIVHWPDINYVCTNCGMKPGDPDYDLGCPTTPPEIIPQTVKELGGIYTMPEKTPEEAIAEARGRLADIEAKSEALVEESLDEIAELNKQKRAKDIREELEEIESFSKTEEALPMPDEAAARSYDHMIDADRYALQRENIFEEDGIHDAPYAAVLLNQCAKLYAERNAVYKDNFRMVGAIMKALFPDGPPALETVQDYNRWHLFELAIVKLSRYAVTYNEGGHEDSLDDLIVYMAMVAQCDHENGHR